MTGHRTPLRDKTGLTFGEHLRAQRLAALEQPPIIEPFPKVVHAGPPVRTRPRYRARNHIQREAAARLRELQTNSRHDLPAVIDAGADSDLRNQGA